MKHVSIEITQKCSNKCIHCSSIASKECSIYIGTEKLKEIIDGVSVIGTKSISISGGEPFLHEGLLEVVAYAVSKKISVDIYTSGIIYDNNGEFSSLHDETIKKLRDIGVNKLVFNMQSLKSAVYDEIMQTHGNLELLIESLKKSKKNGIFTEIHFVPMKINLEEIDDMINFVSSLNLDKISFLGLITHGRAKLNKDRIYLDNEASSSLKMKLKKIVSEKTRVGMPLQTDDIEYSCNAGKEKLYIKFDGKVYGCEAFKYINLYDEERNEITPDSIHDRSIESIFKDSKYLQAEAKFIKEQQKNIVSNEKCPVQKYIRRN